MSAKTRNIVIRILAALCALGLLAMAAYSQELSVKIIRTSGKVEVRASGQTAWAKAVSGKEIKPGDTLRTLKGGKVQILFPHNTLVIIKENSVLNVKELKAEGGAKVKTVMGGFLFNLQEALSPGSTFEVETPTALAVVRGTRLGVDVAIDGTSDFTGYEGSFEVIAQGVTQEVSAGQRVGVKPGQPPSEPEITDATWEGAGGEDEAEVPTYTEQQYISRFNALANRFRLLAVRMDEFYQEYVRYEAAGDTARVELLYFNLQPVMEQCDQLDEAAGELVASLSADLSLGWIVTGDEPTLGTDESGAAISGDIVTCRDSSARIRSRYETIELSLSAIYDPRELLDDIRGVIESRDPARDIRYGSIDTDNDGVPDVVELRLQGEINAEEPMIVLISPDDNKEYFYPDDDSIFFEFEAAGEEYFAGFELHLRAGGYEMVRQFVGNSMDLSIPELVTSASSPFLALFSEGASVEFTWFVRGMFDFQQWGADTSESYHQTSAVINIDSETRSLNLFYPAGQIVDFGLAVIGPTPVMLGEPIRLRVDVDEVAMLARWEIVINYDPSLVEFSSGVRSGVTNRTTLFFGDDGRGRMAISGEIPSGTSPLSGSGAFAEISFMAQEAGIALFSFSEIRLFTASGQRIGATDGGGAEVEIAFPMSE